MDQAQCHQLLRFFKTLANKSRLKIVGILANREASVSDLADSLDLREPAISHHLSILKELELVTMRAKGNAHIYRLNGNALIQMNKDLFSAQSMAALAEKVDKQGWEGKVLRTFVIDDRLTQIPAQHKKRLVVLKWLVEKFEPGVRYPERKVNEIIQRHHPDTASLRRYLVDHRFMQREHGVYWRVTEDEG